jgi:hypothetical protein
MTLSRAADGLRRATGAQALADTLQDYRDD